jgi:hypothetical protein
VEGAGRERCVEEGWSREVGEELDEEFGDGEDVVTGGGHCWGEGCRGVVVVKSLSGAYRERTLEFGLFWLILYRTAA